MREVRETGKLRAGRRYEMKERKEQSEKAQNKERRVQMMKDKAEREMKRRRSYREGLRERG